MPGQEVRIFAATALADLQEHAGVVDLFYDHFRTRDHMAEVLRKDLADPEEGVVYLWHDFKEPFIQSRVFCPRAVPHLGVVWGVRVVSVWS